MTRVGRGPAEDLQAPAGGGDHLAGSAGGVQIAAGPHVGLDQRQAEVDAEADLLDGGAGGAGSGGGLGVAGDVLGRVDVDVPGEQAQSGGGDQDEQQGDQGAPGLIAVADDQLELGEVGPVGPQRGAGAPSRAGYGPQLAVAAVVLLGDQDASRVSLVSGGPVHGSQLLPGLRHVTQSVTG